MQLVTSMFGTGWLQVGRPDASEAQFVIGIWREADGRLSGRGQIAGDVHTIRRAETAPGSVPLVLSDGRAVDVTISQRRAGNDWADIDILQPEALLRPATLAEVA